MGPGKINLYIVSDNALVVNGLRHFLEAQFPNKFNVSGYFDLRKCIRHIDQETQVVICDANYEGRSSEEAIRTIRVLNPLTKVIVHTDKNEVGRQLHELYFSKKEEQEFSSFYMSVSPMRVKWN